MQTLKQLKENFYDDYLINRNNFHLSDEERNIIDNLEGEDGTKYTKTQAINIAYEHLDGIETSEIEASMWEAGFIRGYEIALNDLYHLIKDFYKFKNTSDVLIAIKYLLTK